MIQFSEFCLLRAGTGVRINLGLIQPIDCKTIKFLLVLKLAFFIIIHIFG